jgi:hypothetical protein
MVEPKSGKYFTLEARSISNSTRFTPKKRFDSEADSTSRPQFHARACHRTIILSPCNTADHKRSKCSMANEINLPDGATPSSHIPTRNEEITLTTHRDPGIYQVEHDTAPGSGKALIIEIGVDANRYERMPLLC